ncbi:hypothetical protein FQN60_018811 [Etheostoma spectabile]|uniref:Uncharacterized protein n=1 Tax=Etheostoma spectabile TaxID=54343 RepID=A0A5J5CG77_9PERO|nr:hypothetical protein FQN60_018811 [Etheostoma spectabile]
MFPLMLNSSCPMGKVPLPTTPPLKGSWQKESEKQKEEEGLLLILPCLSPRPPLHRLFPPPPNPPPFLLRSILSRLPLFPVQ